MKVIFPKLSFFCVSTTLPLWSTRLKVNSPAFNFLPSRRLVNAKSTLAGCFAFEAEPEPPALNAKVAW